MDAALASNVLCLCDQWVPLARSSGRAQLLERARSRIEGSIARGDARGAYAELRQLGTAMRAHADGLGLGDGAGNAATAAQSLQAEFNQLGGVGGLSTDQLSQQLNSELLSLGVQPDVIAGAVQQYGGLAMNALGAMDSFATGKVAAGIQQALPLVSAALIASGVGAPAAAVVVAGAGLLASGLASKFLAPQTTTCDWKLSPYNASKRVWNTYGVCFQGNRPYGPKDANWLTVENFQNSDGSYTPPYGNKITWQQVDSNNKILSSHPTQSMALAFGWWGPIGQTMQALGDSSFWAAGDPFGFAGKTLYMWKPQSDPETQAVAEFIVAFCRTMIRASEFQLNGFNPINLGALIIALSMTWNAGREPGTTFQFDGHGKGMFIDYLLNGNVDGNDYPAFTIHTGPRLFDFKPGVIRIARRPPASSPTSTASKAGVVLVGTTALGLAAWLALGRPLSWSAIKEALQSL